MLVPTAVLCRVNGQLSSLDAFGATAGFPLARTTKDRELEFPILEREEIERYLIVM
jgi:hypothetical protein